MNRYGYTWDAIGRYNAKSIDKRNRYAYKIWLVMMAMKEW